LIDQIETGNAYFAQLLSLTLAITVYYTVSYLI